MREALHQRAVQLPAEGGTYREFADDTDDALASGCDGAAVALIERSLREAVNAMPAGLDIYDEQDRLVLCNDQMARLRPHLPVAESLGKTYEELLREGLRHGIPEEAKGQEELWLAHELAIRGHRPGPEVRQSTGLARFCPPERPIYRAVGAVGVQVLPAALHHIGIKALCGLQQGTDCTGQ